MNSNIITISLPQVPIIKGNITENLNIHLEYIEKSALHGAHVVVFPELSLTGYELQLAEKLAFQANCLTFKILSQSAIDNNIIVIVGCPLANKNSKPLIGALICFPDGNTELYAKQYLHQGEDKYCSAGVKDYIFSVAGYRIALAICADFCVPKHAQNAVEKGADLYIVSAMISESGYENDASILSDISTKYKMPVLLSNHISSTGEWDACGKNSVWVTSAGIELCTKSKQVCLLLCTISDNTTIQTILAD